MRLPSPVKSGEPSGGCSNPTTPPRFWSDEYVAPSRPTATTSSYFVTTQKPGPSGSGCLYTGALFRRYVNQSWGTPCVNLSRSSRSMSLRSMASRYLRSRDGVESVAEIENSRLERPHDCAGVVVLAPVGHAAVVVEREHGDVPVLVTTAV